jgi:hypothetical protein
VAADVSPDERPQRWVKPDDVVGRREQGLRPAEETSLGDEILLLEDPTEHRIALGYTSQRPPRIYERERIQVVVWQIEESRYVSGERGLASARDPDDVHLHDRESLASLVSKLLRDETPGCLWVRECTWSG